LDENVHAPGIGLHARPWKVLPSRIESSDVAATARQLPGDARNNPGARHARQARQSSHGSRWYAEERNEQRILRAEIHVRQIKKSDALAQAAYHRSQPVLSGHQHALAESGAAVQQDLVERRILLVR